MDSNSALAAEVNQATKTNYKRPSFTDVPRKPTDNRTPQSWRSSVVDIVGARRPLVQWAAENPPEHGGSDQFAEGARASLPSDEVGPTPTDATQDTEAFAAAIRAQAAPPP